MVLLWILVPVFIFIVGPVNLANAGGDWASAVVSTLVNLGSGLLIAAGIVTLLFAMVERTSAKLGAECKWDPLQLPPVRRKERRPSVRKAVCEFGFNIFSLVWLLLVPHYPILILGPAAPVLRAGPLLHTFYLPFVLLSVVALARIRHQRGAASVDMVSAPEPAAAVSPYAAGAEFHDASHFQGAQRVPVRGLNGCVGGFA
jgi:hypothetical protein